MGWRDRAASPKAPAGKRDWQAQQTVATTKKGWSRQSKFLVAGVGFLLFAGAMVWLILKLFPPKPATLVLIGADYNETSLAIPHNEYGWQGLQDLHAWSKKVQGGGHWWGKTGMPVFHGDGPEVLQTTKSEWDKGLDSVKNDSIVIFMALHGGADREDAYLLPEKADPGTPNQRLHLSTILERLTRDDLKSKNIVLVLDPTQVQANAFNGHGMLHNDFVRRLKEHDKQIADSGNLVVICSSSEDQRSWVSEEWRQTIFGHYFAEALKGATGKGNLTALDLFDYLADKVPTWVGANRADLQEPILLPAGDTGRERAKKVVLEVAPEGYMADDADDAPGAQLDLPADWLKNWKDQQQLADSMPSPAVYSPRQWRRYREVLLRYEQLVRAGQSSKAADRAKELADLKKSIEQARSVSLTCWSTSLATGPALDTSVPWLWGKGEYQDKFNGLLSAPDPSKTWEDTRTWAEGQNVPDNREQRVRLLKQRFAGMLLQGSALNRDGMDPAKLDLLLEVIDRDKDGWFSPAEVNFARMLPYLTKDALLGMPKDKNWPWRRVLELRRVAEETAWTIGAGNPDATNRHPYAEIVYRWIKSKVDKADEVRRKCEDRLYAGDPQEWKQMEVELEQAEKIYADAGAEAVVVRDALSVRDEIMADLPYLSRWLADRRMTDATDAERLAKDAKAQVALWDAVHKLAARFQQQQVDGWIRGAKPRDVPDAGANAPGASLKDQAQSVWNDYDTMKRAFLKRCDELSDRKVDTQRVWQEIDDALEVPWLPADVRKRLLTLDRATSSGFNKTPPKNAGIPKKPEQEEIVHKAANRAGDLSLAVVGGLSFDRLIDPKFGVASDWWQTADRAADEVGNAWQVQTKQITTLMGKDRRARADQLDADVAEADRLARLVDGTAKPPSSQDPSAARRRLNLHRFLCWQAERSYKDHWYDREGKDYYRAAAGLLLDNAERLMLLEQEDLADDGRGARLQQVVADRARFAPYSMRITRTDIHSSDQTITWTNEPVLKLQYRWQVIDEKGQLFKESLNGFPTYWKAADAPLPPPKDNRQVKVQRGLERKSEATDDAELAFPGPDLRGAGQVAYSAMFRGQVVAVPTTVVLQSAPDVVVYQHKASPGGAIAARSSLTTHLSIIVDLSGSMQYPLNKNETISKKDAAVKALNSLLPALNANEGVKVSIRVLGPKGDAEHPLVLCSAEKWTAANKQTILDSVKRLGAYKPEGWTPLVDTVTQAHADMLKTKDDTNIILVLTDGVDEGPQGPTPSKAVRTSLADLIKPGLQFNVVLLNLSDKERTLAHESFDWMTETTPVQLGRIFEVTTIDEMNKQISAAMADAVYPKLRLYIKGGRNLPKKESGGDIAERRGYKMTRPEDPQLVWSELLKVDPLVAYPPLATKESLQEITLKDGERLILKLDKAGGGNITFKRGLYVEDLIAPFAKKNAQKSSSWWLAEHLNRLTGKAQADLFFTLENFKDLTSNGQLEQIQPGFVWFEVSSDPTGKPLPVEFGTVSEFPAPAWYVRVRDWPGGKARPVIRAWVSRDYPQVKSATIESADIKKLMGGGKVNRTVTVAGTDIEVSLSLAKNQTVKLSHPGALGPVLQDKRDCLVVRFEHPLGKHFVLKQEGLKEDGHEHQFFFTKTGGEYTTTIWLDPETGLPKDGTFLIQLFQLEEFKARAEQLGEKIDLQLTAPPDVQNQPPSPPEVK